MPILRGSRSITRARRAGRLLRGLGDLFASFGVSLRSWASARFRSPLASLMPVPPSSSHPLGLGRDAPLPPHPAPVIRLRSKRNFSGGSPRSARHGPPSAPRGLCAENDEIEIASGKWQDDLSWCGSLLPPPREHHRRQLLQ